MTAAGANGNDRPAPETALAVLASEHRLSILQAFYEAYEPGTIEVDRSLSFAEIYERTDTASTAQFSYHVEKLVGRYLTETADGYALTYAGVKLRQALRTGTYTDVPDREAIPIEEDVRCATRPPSKLAVWRTTSRSTVPTTGMRSGYCRSRRAASDDTGTGSSSAR